MKSEECFLRASEWTPFMREGLAAELELRSNSASQGSRSWKRAAEVSRTIYFVAKMNIEF